MIVSTQLNGDRNAILRFEQFPEIARQRLAEAMARVEARLENAIRSAAPRQTGRLAGLIGGRVYEHPNRIAAVVGVRTKDPNEAKKAAALEYGSRGAAITVQRRIAGRSALGRISGKSVGSWTRTPTIKPHRFLRGPAEMLKPAAMADLQRAVDQAVQDTNR